MTTTTPSGSGTHLPCDEILRIARLDAETVYPDLNEFQITLSLKSDGWHVDYLLTDPFSAGGGPAYVIDPVTGVILAKCYYQ